MKKKIVAILPFLTMPIFIPIYIILDIHIFVDVFGCGCVPSIQTNMLNIPFNANDLRLVVFAALTIILSVCGINISKSFDKKLAKSLYCIALFALNVILTMWVMIMFAWR